MTAILAKQNIRVYPRVSAVSHLGKIVIRIPASHSGERHKIGIDMFIT